jgi:hypothetical protein
MKKKRKKAPSLISRFLRIWKRSLFRLQERWKQDRVLIQRIQLTVMYYLAYITLLFSIRSTLGEVPPIFMDLVPFADFALQNTWMQCFGRVEVTFLLYLLTVEFIIYRPILKFSLLVKYNILLLYLLELIYNLIISWWDVLYIREVDTGPVLTDQYSLYNFVIMETFFFFILYIYSYICAMRGKAPKYPFVLQKIPDSVAFWLRLKPKNLKKK